MENYNSNFEQIYLPTVKIKEEEEDEPEVVEVEMEEESSESHESEQEEEKQNTDEEMDEDDYFGEPEEISQQEAKVVIGSTSCSFGKTKTKKVQLLRCKHCKFLFDSKDLLLIHQTYTHKISADDTLLNAAFKSILCQYEFFGKLTRLTRKHKNLKVYCPTCDKDFDVKHYFALHLIECYHNENFLCPFCCKKKSCISDLTKHMRNHFFTLGALTCDICNIKYFNGWNLSTHKARCHDSSLQFKVKVETKVSPSPPPPPPLPPPLPPPPTPIPEIPSILNLVDYLSDTNDMFLNPNVLPSSMLSNNDLDINLPSNLFINHDVDTSTIKIENQEVITKPTVDKPKVPKISKTNNDKKSGIVKIPDFVFSMQNRKDDSAKIMEAAVNAVSQKKPIPIDKKDLKQRLVYKDGNKVCILSEKDSEILKQKIMNQKLNSSEKFALVMNNETRQMKIIKVVPKAAEASTSSTSENNLAFKGPGYEVLTTGEVVTSEPTQSESPQASDSDSESQKSTETKKGHEIRKHLPRGRYPCRKCGLLLKAKDYYDHLYCHVYKCPFCSLLICSQHMLDTHLGFKLELMNMKCEYIARPSLLQSVNPLYFNKGIDHGGKQHYLDAKDITNSKYTCNVCRQNFSYQCHLIRHQISFRHDINIYQCATCLQKFCNSELFKFHTQIHNNEQTKCQLCSKVFIDLQSFLRHLYVKHFPNTYGICCHYCLELKLNEEKLQKHITKNHSNLKYMCKQCDLHFAKEIVFYQHLKEQHDIIKFICSLCGAKFSNSALELQHEKCCSCKKVTYMKPL